MTVFAGNIIYAADINDRAPVSAIKTADESVVSSTTLQNDDALFCALRANTNYRVDLALLATQAAAGTGVDIKCAWTMPSGCTLDLAVVGPHTAWVAGAGAALEVEWAGWQNQTSSPTGTVSFGTIQTTVFSYHARGVIRVGSTAGTLQFQWAQQNSSASDLTVKAGSSLTLTPLP
jgi:hypothetical protein